MVVDDIMVLEKACLSKLFLGLGTLAFSTNLVLFISLG